MAGAQIELHGHKQQEHAKPRRAVLSAKPFFRVHIGLMAVTDPKKASHDVQHKGAFLLTK